MIQSNDDRRNAKMKEVGLTDYALMSVRFMENMEAAIGIEPMNKDFEVHLGHRSLHQAAQARKFVSSCWFD
jgi:hypothetical protein